jgi:hypothetical protein
MDANIIIVEHLNTPLSPKDRSFRKKKISKETLELGEL